MTNMLQPRYLNDNCTVPVRYLGENNLIQYAPNIKLHPAVITPQFGKFYPLYLDDNLQPENRPILLRLQAYSEF